MRQVRPFTIVGQKSKGQKQFLTAVIDQNRFWPTISLLYFSRSGSKFCTIVELYCSLSFLTCSLDEVKNECVFDLLWTKVKNKMEKILVFDLYRDMVGQKHEVRNDRFWTFSLVFDPLLWTALLDTYNLRKFWRREWN